MSKKITELGKLSIAANTDVLLIVENPSTTPTNKYIEVGDLMDNSGAMALPGLDIDGGIDIGAPIIAVDLFVVDDGAGGTNRKAAASRVLDYVYEGTENKKVKQKGACLQSSTHQGLFL